MVTKNQLIHEMATWLFLLLVQLSYAPVDGEEISLDTDFVFQEDDFNISCAYVNNQPCDLKIFHPQDDINPALLECADVGPAFSDYVRGFCSYNGTHRSITMEVTSGNYTRDDGTFRCQCLSSDTLTMDVLVPVSINSCTDDFVNPDEGEQIIFCESTCGYPTKVNFTWTGIQSSGTDDLFYTANSTEVPCPGDKTSRTTSTVLVNVSSYEAITCCAVNTQRNDPSATCRTITITKIVPSTGSASTTPPIGTRDPRVDERTEPNVNGTVGELLKTSVFTTCITPPTMTSWSIEVENEDSLLVPDANHTLANISCNQHFNRMRRSEPSERRFNSTVEITLLQKYTALTFVAEFTTDSPIKYTIAINKFQPLAVTEEGLSDGEIAGIAVACGIAIVIIVVVIVWFVKKNK